jgi:hypothetical protein
MPSWRLAGVYASAKENCRGKSQSSRLDDRLMEMNNRAEQDALIDIFGNKEGLSQELS